MVSYEVSGEQVTVTHDDTRWSIWGLWVAIVFVVLAAYHFGKQPNDTEKAIGCIGAAAVFAIFYLAAYERSVFVFNLRNRSIKWSRRRVLSQRQGILTFAQVKSVVALMPIGDDGTPSRRVVLLTDKGELPISLAYKPDINNESLAIAARLNDIVRGHPAADPVIDGVQALIDADKTLDAIRMLRTERNLSLTEAHEMVEKLKAGSRSQLTL